MALLYAVLSLPAWSAQSILEGTGKQVHMLIQFSQGRL